MAESWYYVLKGQRHGPVSLEVLQQMMTKDELNPQDFIWKKGFENWKKITDVSEVQVAKVQAPEVPAHLPPVMDTPAAIDFSFSKIGADERQIFVRIGTDRGGATADYGPFSLNQLKTLFEQKRINGKTSFFVKGMKEWSLLGDHKEYSDIFEAQPPVIQPQDRRTATRKPFVARMFIQNNKKVFEGICRDVSIGGMQVLIDQFPGAAGEKISINVHPENSEYHFVASGQIVRLLEGNNGFSFRFQQLSDEAKKAIDKYIGMEAN